MNNVSRRNDNNIRIHFNGGNKIDLYHPKPEELISDIKQENVGWYAVDKYEIQTSNISYIELINSRKGGVSSSSAW